MVSGPARLRRVGRRQERAGELEVLRLHQTDALEDVLALDLAVELGAVGAGAELLEDREVERARDGAVLLGHSWGWGAGQ